MSGLSFLDRLSDEQPRGSAIGALREALRRDLEALLNARRNLLSWPMEYEELERSLVNYGLDDFTNETRGSDDFRDEFIEAVEKLLRRFEPRLGRFEVSVISEPDSLDRTLRFRITGVVTLDDERQEVHFDSHADPVRGFFVVRP